MVSDFDDLKSDIAEALRLIDPADRNASPVIVVNSDKELERQQESFDFDKRPVWRILVGGNKLSRGFTVEGLTVTYYRRTGEGQAITALALKPRMFPPELTPGARMGVVLVPNSATGPSRALLH